MNAFIVDSDEAMKRGNEALNTSLLHRYDFLLSVKGSLPLFFKENHRLMFNPVITFLKIHRLTIHGRCFIK
jgi:hypothetical protein